MTTFILSKEQYTEYNTHFNTAARSKNITSGDMILNNILRNKDIRRGFTPITNSNKLIHGANEWQGFNAACFEVRQTLFWPHRHEVYRTKFGLDLTPELIAAIKSAMEV